MIAKVSVIVAVFNGVDTAVQCLRSIAEQRGVDVEIIVIDGLSTDGTVELIKEIFLDKISYFVSEKDRGIYDAWNKGLKLATGDWICFLGIDDFFENENSAADVLSQGLACMPNADLIFSRGRVIDSAGRTVRIIGEPWVWSETVRYIRVCHPGAMHRRTLFEEIGEYDISYKICADFDFFMRCGLSRYTAFAPVVAVAIGNEGISRTHAQRAFSENMTIQKRYRFISRIEISWVYSVARLKFIVRRMLGR